MIATWQRFHPTWKIKVWRKSDLVSFKFKNKDAFGRAKRVEEKVAILSYEILYQQGGLCVDTSFECLRSFDALHESCDFYTGIGSGKGPARVYNNLIGSQVRHPIMELCINRILARNNDNANEENKQDVGIKFFTECFNRRTLGLGSNVVAFPISFFHPPSIHLATSGHPRANGKKIRPETFAIQR